MPGNVLIFHPLWVYLFFENSSFLRKSYLNQIKTLEEQIEASTKVNVDSTVDGFKTLEEKKRIYTSAKTHFVKATNEAIDAKIKALELNWNKFDQKSSADITAALRAYFTKADDSLDRVRILQLLNDPGMLLTFMSSICRYTGAELPEDAQRLVAGDTSAADALAASQASVKKEGLLRSTYNRLRGRHQRSLGIPAETSGEGSLTTDAPAASGSIPSRGATGSSGSAGRSSMATSRVEVTTVGGGLPGLGAIPGTSISAPSGHLKPPSDRRSRHSGTSAYSNSLKPASSEAGSDNLHRRAATGHETLPAISGLGQIAEWTEIDPVVVSSSDYGGWPVPIARVFRSTDELVDDFKAYLKSRLNNPMTSETLLPQQRTYFESLLSIEDAGKLLSDAGIETFKVEMFEYHEVQMTRDKMDYTRQKLAKRLDNMMFVDSEPYRGVMEALRTDDAPEQFHQAIVKFLLRHPILINTLAYKLAVTDFIDTTDITDANQTSEINRHKNESMESFIDQVIEAVINPMSIPQDELDDPTAKDDLNLAGAFLTLIGAATRTNIKVLRDDGIQVGIFGISNVWSNTLPENSVPGTSRDIRLYVRDGSYYARPTSVRSVYVNPVQAEVTEASEPQAQSSRLTTDG
jgi:hypothetical protein